VEENKTESIYIVWSNDRKTNPKLEKSAKPKIKTPPSKNVQLHELNDFLPT
jgi:hypothetical protein